MQFSPTSPTFRLIPGNPEGILGTPAELVIIPDHYGFRMLHSQGVPLEDLGVPTREGTPVEPDYRIWQYFCENFHLFRGTPTSLWLVDRGLSRAGARVGVLGRREDKAKEVAAELSGGCAEAMALPADVLDQGRLEATRDAAIEHFGRIDMLANAAGGNVSGAIVREEESFFDLPREALEKVLDLLGTVLPPSVFGEAVVQGRGAEGSIVNVSSMAAQRPLTRVVGYVAAKSAVENLTRWLAAELARKHGPDLRVNAPAPGFFLGDQNRALLTNEDGFLTERGRIIIEHTPAGRFGEPDDLVGTVVWLCGPGAGFVNGVMIPIDGGFSALGGGIGVHGTGYADRLLRDEKVGPNRACDARQRRRLRQTRARGSP